MVNRNVFVYHLILLCSAFILLTNVPAYAGTECDRSFFGMRGCVTGIEDFDDQEAESVQEKDQWCWAASISMIFKYYGYDLTQKEIVKQTYGRLVNLPASGKKLGQNLKGTYKTKDEREFSVSVKEYDLLRGKVTLSNKDILRSLEEGRPLIIGSNGHAMVLTAIYYTRTPTGEPFNIVGGIVRDPWPGKGRRELSLMELSPFYVADIEIKHNGSNKGTMDRIDNCVKSCQKQEDDCGAIANEEEDTCTSNCNSSICDHCSNLPIFTSMANSCDRSCDRCTKKCERSKERKSDKCKSKYESCSSKCYGD